MVFLRKFFIVVFVFGFLQIAHAKDEPDGITEPIPVTFEKLVKNPTAFHGKQVRVKGFLSLEFGRNGLFRSKEKFLFFKMGEFSFEYMDDLIGIGYDESTDEEGNTFLSVNVPGYPEHFQRSYVEIDATFDAPCGGGCVKIDGFGWNELIRITNIKLIERPQIPGSSYRAINRYYSLKEGVDYQEHYRVLSQEEEEFIPILQLLENWEKWLRARNISTLEKTAFLYEGQTREDLDFGNPENPVYHYLFNLDFWAQRAIKNSSINWVIHKENQLPEEDEIDFSENYLACACLEEDCGNLWPIGLSQSLYQSLSDDFFCLRVFKVEEEWQWG